MKTYKIFKIAFFIHIGYILVSLLLTLIIFRNQNDFLIYFKAGGLSITNINQIYNQINYRWPYRYFPITALLFAPFYLLGFDIGFSVFLFLNLIIILILISLMYNVILNINFNDHKIEEEDISYYCSLFLIGLPILFNYILGQINLLVVIFIFLSLLIFIKHDSLKYNLLAGIILGLSFLVKPITFLIIPFLLIIRYNKTKGAIIFEFQKSIIRILGVFIPVLLNIVFFLIFPKLLIGFIQTNLTGTEEYIMNFSFSITKLVTNFLYIFHISFNEFLIFLMVVIPLLLIAFYFFILKTNKKINILYGYILGIIIMLLSYFDSWDHHLLILTPLLIIVILSLPKEKKIRKYLKWSFYFFTFIDLAFMGLWYLIKDFFPFNFESTIFLCVCFYSILKLLKPHSVLKLKNLKNTKKV
ncbi:MAG: glycosyltransferase 87 family protein [Candidatus Lokiarchaeota archaeon]